MKKGIIVLLIAAALIVLLSPGIIGRIAEDSVDENLRWAAEENDGIVITSESFDRGWFSSAGRHRVEIRDPAAREALREAFGAGPEDGFPTLVINTTLDHGLIPVTSMSRDGGSLAPRLGRATSTMFIEFPDGETFPVPGKIFSDIGLDGALKSNYLLEPGSHEVQDTKASWGATDIHFEADPGSGSFVVSGAIASIEVVNERDTMTIEQTTFSGDQVPTPFGFAVGEFSIEMESVEVVDANADSVGFGPFSMTGNAVVDGDRVNGNVDMSMAGVDVPGYGEMGLDVGIRFTGVDGAALGRLSQSLEEVDSDAPPQLLFELLQDDLQDLFSAGFELEFERFDFQLPQGPVTSTMRFNVPESDAGDFAWTSLLLDLDAKADLSVAEGFVDFAMATNPQAGAIVGMGYLRRNGDVYEMRAEYSKGLLTINGAPMPIPLGQ